MLESYKPNLVYLQGEQLENDVVGPLAWRDVDLSTAESISEIFDATLPTTVSIKYVRTRKMFNFFLSNCVYTIYFLVDACEGKLIHEVYLVHCFLLYI